MHKPMSSQNHLPYQQKWSALWRSCSKLQKCINSWGVVQSSYKVMLYCFLDLHVFCWCHDKLMHLLTTVISEWFTDKLFDGLHYHFYQWTILDDNYCLWMAQGSHVLCYFWWNLFRIINIKMSAIYSFPLAGGQRITIHKAVRLQDRNTRANF